MGDVWDWGGLGGLEKLLDGERYRLQYHETARWTRHLERFGHHDCLQNISPQMKMLACMRQKQRRVDIRRHLNTYRVIRNDCRRFNNLSHTINLR